ncbi:MAG: DUF4388 domain-containing protein [Acidobacteriota bacterium]
MQNRIYKESRSSRRVSFIGEVECSGEEVGRFTTRMNDLSATGAFIDSMCGFAAGTRMKLRFRVGETLIETTGEVRYSLRNAGMGVRFLDLRPEHREVISCLVEGKPLPATGPLEAIAEAEEAIVLAGSFAALSFFDVIHLMDSNRLTGKMTVNLPAAKGEIYFKEGLIVGAASGDAGGSAALSNFVGATTGTFEFRQSAFRYPRNIESANNTSLMLDLLADRENAPVCS